MRHEGRMGDEVVMRKGGRAERCAKKRKSYCGS
jgi:hypothetical protein